MRPSRFHGALGFAAIFLISTFWISTVVSEALLGHAAVVTVKTAIPYGLLVLIPVLAVLGASGFVLGKGWRGAAVSAKRRRMPFIALNGICVLAPSALYLSYKANLGAFDVYFYGVQSMELAFGALNLLLLGLSARDGLKLASKGVALKVT